MAVVDLTLNNAASKVFGSLGNYDSAVQNTRNLPSICSRTLTTGAAASLLTANQYDIMTIPAGAFVKSVTVIIKTASGETTTMDVGDSTSDTAFLTAMDMNGTAGTSVTSAVTAGKYYASADKLRLNTNHNMDLNGVFTVIMELIYPN